MSLTSEALRAMREKRIEKIERDIRPARKEREVPKPKRKVISPR